jgi:hypothetical protein
MKSKTLNLHSIRCSSTQDGRSWDYLPGAIRYFSSEAKALAALKKEIAEHKKYGNWVTVKKKEFEAAYERQWIVKEKIRIEA